MQTICALVMLVTMIGAQTSSKAQTAPASNQSDSVSVHVSLQKNTYAIGEKPIVVMTVKNISENEVWFSTASYLYRIHLTTKNGEPPKTELYRHMLGDFRPGDGPALLEGPVVGRKIFPDSETAQKYDLAYFYDLSTPGDYSVSMELCDPSSPPNGPERWIKTNIAHFEIKAPTPQTL
ncbi:hypothetical protein HNQ77_004169 [Silvibacterium bohemicum]|uniref:Intracellular proteinase inhibitor BsuPI domain-containing protein n=1 Tax=Silvibacterium bohemicum TaxID=1577686 RepID=A0A841K0S9_9BACT|nr:hypothetical protein [Silvibacterium bohemicum]MBB6146197.1 hypothetical protein [Silvibacterium bohemicum]